MNKPIQDIIQASIDTKQQLLQNEELLATIDKVVDTITTAFKNGKKFIYAVMEEVRQMPNTLQQSFLVVLC